MSGLPDLLRWGCFTTANQHVTNSLALLHRLTSEALTTVPLLADGEVAVGLPGDGDPQEQLGGPGADLWSGGTRGALQPAGASGAAVGGGEQPLLHPCASSLPPHPASNLLLTLCSLEKGGGGWGGGGTHAQLQPACCYSARLLLEKFPGCCLYANLQSPPPPPEICIPTDRPLSAFGLTFKGAQPSGQMQSRHQISVVKGLYRLELQPL